MIILMLFLFEGRTGQALKQSIFSLGYLVTLYRKVLPLFFFHKFTELKFIAAPQNRKVQAPLVNCHSQACSLNVFSVCSVSVGKKQRSSSVVGRFLKSQNGSGRVATVDWGGR
jgi:hypothetical protein